MLLLARTSPEVGPPNSKTTYSVYIADNFNKQSVPRFSCNDIHTGESTFAVLVDTGKVWMIAFNGLISRGHDDGSST